MVKTKYTGLFVFLLIIPNVLKSQNHLGQIQIPYTKKEINIDGDLNEWKNYYSLTFTDNNGELRSPKEFPFDLDYPENYEKLLPKPKSLNQVNIKLCWDINNLYIGFDVKDQHLFAQIIGGKDNPDIYYNDGIEIYIDAANDSKNRMDINDYQFMIDIFNNRTVFKGEIKQINNPAEYAVPKENGQNILFKSAIKLFGFPNDTLNKAIGYIVEIKIPFTAIGIEPETGKKIKLDICNNDVDSPLSKAITIDSFKIVTKSFDWAGYNNFGFPKYWKQVQLSGSMPWFEKLSYHKKSRWFTSFLLIVLLSFIVYVYLLYQIKKLKKLPTRKNLSPFSLNLIEKSDNIDSQDKSDQLIKEAKKILIEKHIEVVNSEKLAKELNISLRKLQRITKEKLQCTPTNFIYIIKLSQAAEFLKNNKGNVSDTAYEFGFSDPSYFSKLFKKYYGVSPSQFDDQVIST